MARDLDEYRRKRHFDVTSEPAPGKRAKRQGAASFMIHKHDATRLHYDVRLEIDGVLVSWAVPKGPSLDPSVKRLAVQTEDHPLEYASFEGRIPEGEYGAGDSIIWDRGTFETEPPGQAAEQLKKGRLTFILNGEKLKGRWHLVRTRAFGSKQQWLMFKSRDEFASDAQDIVSERPESVKSGQRTTRPPERRRHLSVDPLKLLDRVWPPMLATLGDVDEVSTETHVLELKYDGYRALAALRGGRVMLQSRNGLELNERYPDVAAALAKLKVSEAVVDGEVIALGRSGRSRFQNLQASATEHRYVIFDLLWLDGRDLRSLPLEERRAELERLMKSAKLPLKLAERVRGPIDEALARAERQGHEGLMAKLRGGPYVGERSHDWVKLKVAAAQEFAILGYTPISNGKAQIGALLVGLHEEGGYRYTGKVGTGFTAKVRAELLKRLRPTRTREPRVIGMPRVKGACWVEPELVAQIAFAEWTHDGKLRQPRYLGLRDDKRPEECVREPMPARGERRAATRMAARRASRK